MCQANLYLVPKHVPKEEVIRSVEKHNRKFSECYCIIDSLADNYNFYSGFGCDCNSIVSRLRDEKVSNFDEYKVKKKDEDMKKLVRMKMLKASEDYEQRIEKFNNEKDVLWDRVESLTRHIDVYHVEGLEQIDSLKLQEKEEGVELDMLLAKENEMFNEVYYSNEYQATLKQYHDYLHSNQELWESTLYNIEKNEKTVAEYNFSDYYEEFNNLKNIYTEVLKVADEICIYPFWMDEEPMEIKGERQVMLQNLKIEDLVFLPYRNLLKIRCVSE